MSRKRVIIIGAGPAGLSAAYSLAKENVEVEVFEASPHIGGMSRSFDLWSQRVDLGPHRFFSNDNTVNDFFAELIKEDYTVVNRLTRIHYGNKFFYYPLKLGNVIRNLPFTTIVRVLFDYTIQRIKPIRNPKSFDEWVINRFGKKLYTIFFKNYTEKLWGIDASDIDVDWAAQRIKTLSLYGAVKNAMFGGRNNKHKTLVDQFHYPKQGTGTLYERAAEQVEKNGGKVHLSTPVKKLIVAEKAVKGVELMDGSLVYADEVISSMPITKLVEGFSVCPPEVKKAKDELFFRNTILVYLNCDSNELFKDNWIYVHSADVQLGRITNFRNWCPSLNGDEKSTILCLEYWAFDKDEIWSMEDTLLGELGISELSKLGLMNDSVKVLSTSVIRVPKCYPVYQTGYQKHLKVIESYLDTYQQLTVIGRYGAFKYNNQDHSILMGILAARNILSGEKTNLWEVNTDSGYQEDAKIKDVLIQ
jgi:protoporphyrinogen oxidase